jgi:uncharacterized protein YjbI with pentapeptide repeats
LGHLRDYLFFFSAYWLILIQFTNCSLAKVNFSGQDLGDAGFTKVDLSGANFTSAHLKAAVFVSCNFKGLNMSRYVTNSSTLHEFFTSTFLYLFIFQRSHTVGVTMDATCVTTMDNVNFQGCKLEHVAFANGSLRDANLQGCKLDNCNFNNANLTNADFSGSSLVKVNLDV